MSLTIMYEPYDISSGKLTQLLNMAIEIVDIHINSMVIFHSYVKLPYDIYTII